MKYSIKPKQLKAPRYKYDISYDHLVRENERYIIISIARSIAWQLKKKGKYSLRKWLNTTPCSRSLVEVSHWIDTPLFVENMKQSTKHREVANENN